MLHIQRDFAAKVKKNKRRSCLRRMWISRRRKINFMGNFYTWPSVKALCFVGTLWFFNTIQVVKILYFYKTEKFSTCLPWKIIGKRGMPLDWLNFALAICGHAHTSTHTHAGKHIKALLAYWCVRLSEWIYFSIKTFFFECASRRCHVWALISWFVVCDYALSFDVLHCV